MRTLWRGFLKMIFWSYERGSWPYDLMVVTILMFVLVTPRHWFRDQPVSLALAAGDVQLLATDDATALRTYRMNAELLPREKRKMRSTPELEREIHDLFGRMVDELKGRTFQVQRITPIEGADGDVEFYDVTVKPSAP